MKIKKIVIIFALFCFVSIFQGYKMVNADELSDNVHEQLEHIDLSELEDYFNGLKDIPANVDFFESVVKMLNGEFDLNFNSIGEYLLNVFFKNIYRFIPTFVSIIAIAIFCGIIKNIKSNFLSDGVGEIILFVCLMTIILLLASEIAIIYQNTKNTINNIAILSEIMSPIILTLMIASGGTVSASVYKPAVAFLSGGIINVLHLIILPLIVVILIFNIISHFSSTIKLSKFADSATSIIKWVIGLSITIYTVFLSVQGITSATYDGISIKAAKYAISNSIPLVGGFVKDGFDLIVAGSVLIKNTIGVVSVFALFYTIMSPIIYVFAFSMLLKLVSALIEPISDVRISGFCASVSKCVTYLSVVLILVGLMLFITILLMIFSANAFI